MPGWIRRAVWHLRRRIDWIRMPDALKKQVVAHEAGHAFAAWHLEAVVGVPEVSVLPIGPYRGYTMTTNGSEPLKAGQVFELMVMSMAGMAGERLLLGDVSEGGQEDIFSVIAHWLAIQYGMSLSAAQYVAADLTRDLFSEDEWRRSYAEEFVGPALAAFYAAALALLQPRVDGLRRLAKKLRRKKVLRQRDLERLLGPRTYVGIEEIFKAVISNPP